jgi:site-specific DNA-methyltransferase (adenine-specific)
VKPYYQQDNITIYHGDALEILPGLDVAQADIVIADPPYMIGSASTRRGERQQSPVADWINSSRWYAAWLREVFRLQKKSAAAWVFGNWRSLPVVEIAVQSLARRITSTLVWDKQWIGVGSMNGLRCQYELAFLLGSKEFGINDRTTGDIWQSKWSSARPSGHQSEKPIDLIGRMIETCEVPHGGLLVDPFTGSGTALAAAQKLHLHAIGIEIDERYCEIAANRLKQGVLFGTEAA